jgi:hypothetical protein
MIFTPFSSVRQSTTGSVISAIWKSVSILWYVFHPVHHMQYLTCQNIKAISSSFHSLNSTQKTQFQLTPMDLQSLYEIRHKLCLGRSALGANREILKALRWERSPDDISHTKTDNVHSRESVSKIPAIHMVCRELNTIVERASRLMERMDGVLGLVCPSMKLICHC